MTLKIPEFALVVLVGPSGSGKSTFARTHFLPTEVISSDVCRGLVADDENSLDATGDAFDVLHFIAAKRLQNLRLTVVDATNVQPFARKPLVALAREHHCLPVAIVLDLPEALCHERNAGRPDRAFGPHVVRNQRRDLKRSVKKLRREGFRYVYELKTPEEVADVTVERTRLWTNKRDEHGPFDLVGDVHGCATELERLLEKLGYACVDGVYRHSEGRKAVFLGDLMDRGPRNLDVFHLVRGMVEADLALCVPGNHDVKLLKKLKGRNVKVSYGLGKTLAELEALPKGERQTLEEGMATFIDGLVSHYVLDGGRLVAAHAGMKEELQGRASGRVREFALYGETTGETDEFGLPVRADWAADYRGQAAVVYGHTPVPEAEWLNGTINLDTGCVFGGKLTALRWPEKELVQVEAEEPYAVPARPFLPEEDGAAERTAQQAHDDLLHLEDVQGKRAVQTRLRGRVTIREENAMAALEVMTRFAADPRWLVYLPPTMSPSETSQEPGLLEHPAEAFAYYRGEGVPRVICEEKHMGSRAVAVVCADAEAARRRFGVAGGEAGIVYTRTGRRFFDDTDLEAALLKRVRRAMATSGLWEELNTDWAVLDCELLPWSAKAQGLLREQYAAVGAAARAAFPDVLEALELAKDRGVEVAGLLKRYGRGLNATRRYVEAYRRYCWPVEKLEDLKLAPFHLLATEGDVHADKDHAWHMDVLGRLARADGDVLHQTAHRTVDVTDARSVADAVAWWEGLVRGGGEGMVVKPLAFVQKGRRGLAQPALKCRGPEYLRIIYGPDYDAPEHLDRLRQRGLRGKRSLALREFALGLEALERFVKREPLRRVHEAVFGVLALESEPVDPRL